MEPAPVSQKSMVVTYVQENSRAHQMTLQQHMIIQVG